MIRYLGASAIAAALGLRPGTVRGWRKAQLRGVMPPIPLKVTRTGRIWCSAEDVESFFLPPSTPQSHFVQRCLESIERRCAPNTTRRTRAAVPGGSRPSESQASK